MRFVSLCTVILVSSLLLPFSLQSQTLPNESFEEWTSSGRPAPFDWEEPTGWKSNNGVTEFSQIGVFRSPYSRTGDYAVSIRTVGLFGEDVPGMMANGNPELDFSTYSVNINSAGTPITGQPSSLTGYYQYSSTTAGDSALVQVILKTYYPATATSEVVGSGEIWLKPSEEYRKFEIPIVYPNDGTPDSAAVIFYSTSPESPLPGGMLILDDIAFNASSSVNSSAQGDISVSLYPNPAFNTIHVEFSEVPIQPSHFIVHDLLGRTVLVKELSGENNSVEVDLPEGLYLYQITRMSGESTVGSIVVQQR
ncbi:MAG: T9SS type A sorting domain-containing protein [Ignavibacteriae bacterium]|nr:T9SS type A sorting domain-containing protein [Ignavibacteriota bacterium]MCB9217616.1 T9SS type A sorting domain-containing protein [Ignavibacteria bacterium]